MQQSRQSESQSSSPLAAEDIFLSPRVVDRRSFEEFSATLRELIDSASEQHTTLLDAAVRARSTSEGVEKIAGALNQRLTAAQQVLPSLDERLGRIEKLLASAVDAAKVNERVAKEVDQHLDATIDDRLGSIERRVAEVAVRLEQRLNDIEQRATVASEQAERAVDARAERLERLLARAEEALPQLEGRAQQAVSLVDGKLGSVGTAIEQRIGEIKRELAAMTGPAVTSLNLLCRRAQELIGRDPRLDPQAADTPPFAAGSLGAMIDRAALIRDETASQDERLGEMRALVDGARGELLEAVQHAAERASELESRQSPLDKRLATMGKACDRIEKFLASHEEVLERASALPTSADLAEAEEKAKSLQAALAGIAQAQDLIAAIEAAGAAEKKRLDQLATKAKRLAKGVDETAEKFSSIESLASEQLAKLEGVLAEPVAELDQQVREAGAWLSQMVERARATQASIDEAGGQVEEAERRLGALLTRLEPWRQVLTRAPEDGLPEFVQGMIAEVRAKVGDELDRAEAVLAALREAAQETRQPKAASRTKASAKNADDTKADGDAADLPPPPTLNPIRFRRTDRPAE